MDVDYSWLPNEYFHTVRQWIEMAQWPSNTSYGSSNEIDNAAPLVGLALSNDLRRSVQYAFHQRIVTLDRLVMWLELAAPDECWGDRSKCNDWAAKHGKPAPF